MSDENYLIQLQEIVSNILPNQKIELKLNIIGTMCIPPDNQDPKPFFKHLLALNQKINLSEISMGMTNDYLDALEYKSTFLRIGTGIFGKRTS